MKYLGIDYGKSRIGLAASDTGQLVRPLGTLQNKGDTKNVAYLSQFLPDMLCIVCGLPLDIDGNETDMSREVRRFGTVLQSQLGVQVVYHNERYSSIEASEIIAGQKSKFSVDAVAAAVILDGYLTLQG